MRVLRYLILIIALILLTSFVVSCGNSTDADSGQNEAPKSADIPAGQIMGHRNVVEGELNQPVEALIQGEVTATAETSEESWMLLRVDSFQLPGSQGGSQGGSINIPRGNEVSISYRKTEEMESINPGDNLSVQVRVMKSKDGPVLVAQDWNVI